MKNKKKLLKQDYINLSILVLFFVILILLIVNEKHVLGSTTDWSSQHIFFPEYFRTLFYKTGDLFPDFAFNLGAGQNIYNFSYYGLFNPVLMLSYLLPKVNMITYIMVSISVLVLASVLLMYKFLRNHEFTPGVSFLASFIFMCATPLFFHMHRHIMFINYMPFLVLGLMGVDKYFDEKKSWLLALSTLLMILMSYYYSVVGIIVLVIYGVYSYIKLNNKITFKNFMIDGMKFVLPILIGVLISCILIVPTFLVILNGRSATTVSISLKDILMPNINLNYILYKSYGIGLNVISIFSLVHLFAKKRENRFLAIVLALIIVCPLINYICNATMYIDAKSLIPFLPLYVLVSAIFIKDLFQKEVNIKLILIISISVLLIGLPTLEKLKYIVYVDLIILLLALLLYYKTNYKILFGISICIVSFLVTLFYSKYDTLVEKDTLYGSEYNNQKDLTKMVTELDSGKYRITNQITPLENTNRIYGNIDYYQSTLYSSTYNMNYNKFYYDVMNNAIQSRNRVITSSAKNYPFLLLMGHKYLITDSINFIGYEKINSLDNLEVYKNDNVLPLGFSSSNLVSLDTFNELGYPYNQDVILKNIVVDKKIDDNITSNVLKKDIEFDLSELEKLDITKDGETTIINVRSRTKITIPLKEKLENTLLYIHFDILEANSCSIGDSIITINGITNKLTCDPWKYHNQNFTFDYTLANEEINELKIVFSKGVYKIKNFETYTLNYNTINNLNENIDEFIFDDSLTKGDIIEGDINVKEDGYFVLSVPFDSGFTVYVDDKLQEIEPVNVDLLGFEIARGNHHIKIEYHAPGKKLGSILSIFGIISLVGLSLYEEKRGIKNGNRKNIKK